MSGQSTDWQGKAYSKWPKKRKATVMSIDIGMLIQVGIRLPEPYYC